MYSPTEITQKQQLVDLIILWKHVFGDNADYIKNFYNYFYREIDILAMEDENRKIVSACHFIPVSMKMRGIFCKGSYLYAAMTEEQHRNQGLMSKLVHKRFNKGYDEDEAFMCVLPASEELYPYYESFGFSHVFNLDLVHLNRNHLSKIKLTLAFDSKLSPEFAYRKSFGVREYAVVKNKRFVDYTEVEYRSNDGVFIPLYGGYLYVKETDHKVFIREAYVTNENLPYIASVLLRSFPDCDDFIFQICPKSAFANHNSTTYKAGSARVINAEAILKLFALKNPTKTMSINLVDELIEKNTGLYLISGGKLTKEKLDEKEEKMSILELNKMVFTNFGEIIPYMNMMLD